MTIKFNNQQATPYIQDDQNWIKTICLKQGKLYHINTKQRDALVVEVHQIEEAKCFCHLYTTI